MSFDCNEQTTSQSLIKHINNEAQSTIDFFEKEISKLRTNRAHPSLVEDIKVDVYGQTMPLKSVAIINVVDSLLLHIQPFDKSTIGSVERALLQDQNIGAQPQNDGSTIKLALPPMSQARRQEMTKSLKKKYEEALIGIRRIRQDITNIVKQAEKNKALSEDTSKRFHKDIQNTVDKVSNNIQNIFSKKEAAIQS